MAIRLLGGFVPGGALGVYLLLAGIASGGLYWWHCHQVDIAVYQAIAAVQRDLAKANADLDEARIAQTQLVHERDLARQTSSQKVEASANDLIHRLDQQRAAVALPEDCQRCRIPARRLLPDAGPASAGRPQAGPTRSGS